MNEHVFMPSRWIDWRRFSMPLVACFTLMLGSGGMATVWPCGGDFEGFVDGLKSEAATVGFSKGEIDSFFAAVRYDEDVIRRDRSQGIFQKSFIEFSKLVMQPYRIDMAAKFENEHRAIFDRVEQQYGVPRGVLLSLLALETDFGLVQGDHNTLNALVTLAYDCRRPELFRPHINAALNLYRHGDFDPLMTEGAWAGEIGMIQMLPLDIVRYGQDGDGDGKVDLRHSVADALMTAGRVLQKHGWQPNQPWLIEVKVPPSLNWAESGLGSNKTVSEWQRLGVELRQSRIPLPTDAPASLLLPHGRKGPAFFALPNFLIYFEWNRSLVYATTSAFFATLLSGEPMYLDGHAEPPLSGEEVIELQNKLVKRGHDVGKIDGIVGKLTRAAVGAEQIKHGLPADQWPTKELLSLLDH